MTCGFTPYFIAFPENYDYSAFIADNTMNAFFFLDIVINFFTAFYDEDFEIVDTYSAIFR